jgi:hypothetical protein
MAAARMSIEAAIGPKLLGAVVRNCAEADGDDALLAGHVLSMIRSPRAVRWALARLRRGAGAERGALDVLRLSITRRDLPMLIEAFRVAEGEFGLAVASALGTLLAMGECDDTETQRVVEVLSAARDPQVQAIGRQWS